MSNYGIFPPRKKYIYLFSPVHNGVQEQREMAANACLEHWQLGQNPVLKTTQNRNRTETHHHGLQQNTALDAQGQVAGRKVPPAELHLPSRTERNSA